MPWPHLQRLALRSLSLIVTSTPILVRELSPLHTVNEATPWQSELAHKIKRGSLIHFGFDGTKRESFEVMCEALGIPLPPNP
jgi:hypothetical protein